MTERHSRLIGSVTIYSKPTAIYECLAPHRCDGGCEREIQKREKLTKHWRGRSHCSRCSYVLRRVEEHPEAYPIVRYWQGGASPNG